MKFISEYVYLYIPLCTSFVIQTKVKRLDNRFIWSLHFIKYEHYHFVHYAFKEIIQKQYQ